MGKASEREISQKLGSQEKALELGRRVAATDSLGPVANVGEHGTEMQGLSIG